MPSRAAPPRPSPLLVVAPPSSERGALFAGLEGRADLRVHYAASVAEALQALRTHAVALLITAPELPAAAVTELLSSRGRTAPPVLVIRDRQAGEAEGWERQGVGVLRRPLLPDALTRSVDVVLGLAARGI